jgi:hypothetical protein
MKINYSACEPNESELKWTISIFCSKAFCGDDDSKMLINFSRCLIFATNAMQKSKL